jgi:hypothetical protein
VACSNPIVLSDLGQAVKIVRCFAEFHRLPVSPIAVLPSASRRKIPPHGDELKYGVEFKDYDRVTLRLRPDLDIAWSGARPIADSVKGNVRTLSFSADPLTLTIAPTEAPIVMVLERDAFDDREALAAFLRDHWDARYDERLAINSASQAADFEVVEPVLAALPKPVRAPARAFVIARLRGLRAARLAAGTLFRAFDNDDVTAPLGWLLMQAPYLVPFRAKVQRLRKRFRTLGRTALNPNLALDRKEDTASLEGNQGRTFFDQILAQLPLYEVPNLIGSDSGEGRSQLWSITLKSEPGIDLGGVARDVFTKVCAELMLPALGLFRLTPNARDGRDDTRGELDSLIPVLSGQTQRLTYAGALAALAFATKAPQQFRFARIVWQFLITGDCSAADILDCDRTMEELIH